jgi:DNA-binding MarR family transcriptional regulator
MATPQSEQSDAPSAGRAHDAALGYLLKHAHLELERRSDAALAPLGMTSRELGVLRVIATGASDSQLEIAAVLQVDRSSMVTIIDALQQRGVVARHPAEEDRRRNVVTMTAAGTALFNTAEQESLRVEAAFLQAVDEHSADALATTLQQLLKQG